MILESQIQKVLNQLCEKMLVLCLLITPTNKRTKKNNEGTTSPIRKQGFRAS